MNISVSVIIPVYNVEKYVELSIISICNQKFINYEIIIVNDGSTDNSMAVVESVLKHITIPYTIIKQNNSGVATARNAGLKKATGEYVCFIDADDIIDENYLSSQHSFLSKNHLDVCFCNFEYTNEKFRYGLKRKDYKAGIIERKQLLLGFMSRKYQIHCCALMIKKRLLIENNLYFNEELHFGEDVEFMWRLLPELLRIGHINAPYYKYLIRVNSIMTNQSIDKILKLTAIYTQSINAMASRYPEDNDVFIYLPARNVFGCIHSFSKQTDNYDNFLDMITKLNYVQYAKQLYNFPDLKIKIFSRILKLNPKLFHMFFKNK